MPAPRLLAAAVAVAALLPSAATADTVVPNNQIVQGAQCVGPLCADGEALAGGPASWIKTGNTPGLRLLQTNTSGFLAQTWDVAGNEASFFVRDITHGSQYPFRIRPGAPTNSVDITASGAVQTGNVLEQDVRGLATAGALDGDAVLAALRTLNVAKYTDAGATHAVADGAGFRAAFGLGASDAFVAPQDAAAVALAAVKALDARVRAIALTPGPKGEKGDTGATGAVGAAGPAGAAGAPGAPAPAADLAAANRRIAALEKANAKLSRSLASLTKKVAKLTKATKKKKH